MLWRAWIFVCLSMWFASGAASAASLTWSITGGTFADGGTLSGTFEQNPVRPRPSTWSLNVAGGGGSFPARSYTPPNSTVERFQWFPNTELTYRFKATDEGTRELRLTPASALDGSVTSVPLSLLNDDAHVECFNCAPLRLITGGSLVLVSATPTLILESLAPDPTTLGAATTATVSIDAIVAFGPPTGYGHGARERQQSALHDHAAGHVVHVRADDARRPDVACAVQRRRQLRERIFECAVVHRWAGGVHHGDPRLGDAQSDHDRRGDHRDSPG
jgi:hypothetical protein